MKKYFKYLFAFLIVLIFYSCDQEISRSPSEPEPHKGAIFVNSTPEGFKIYLDGRFTGRFTPDNVPFIETTLHEIKLKKDLWKDTSIVVEASEEDPPLVEINYLLNKSMYGNISFNSSPQGAEVYLNDSSLNVTTPVVVSGLLPGRYEVRYILPEHRANEAVVSVRSSQTSNINIALKDTSLWVDFHKLTAPLPSNNITTVAVDENDVVWIGTADKGIVKHKGKSWELITVANSILPNNHIENIFVDRENNKWIGTQGGLVKLQDHNSMTVYTMSNSNLVNNNISTIGQDNAGSIWIGTPSGLLKLDGEPPFTLYNYSNTNLPRKPVNVVMPISANDIWVAIDSFVTRFDGNKFEFFNPHSEIQNPFVKSYDIPNTQISGMGIAENGELWACFTPQSVKANGVLKVLTGGIGVFDGTNWTSVLISGNTNSINDLYIGKDGLIWVSSANGLFKYYDLYRSTAYRPQNSGILSLKVNAVAEDSFGNLWIATTDGLSKYKKYLDTD